MAEKLTKEEWEQVQEMRRSKEQPVPEEPPESEPEPFEIEDAAYEEEETKYEKCVGCGYTKLEKGMAFCPKCGGALDWS